MIPKVIHYCWFGGKPLPKSAVKCIDSWKKFFPDYEIKEWNESNYDVKKNAYLLYAYNAKKYAFVSDYARFDILNQFGGLYFDTDVEIIKSYKDILSSGAFMGCEEGGECCNADPNRAGTNSVLYVNPGLGMAAEPGIKIYTDILEFYNALGEKDKNSIISKGFVVPKTTEILRGYGLKNTNEIQTIGGITVYPRDYFNPLESSTGQLNLTERTHSIHWYTASWLSSRKRLRSKLMRPIHRLLGKDFFHRK